MAAAASFLQLFKLSSNPNQIAKDKKFAGLNRMEFWLLSEYPNDVLMPIQQGTKAPKFAHRHGSWTWDKYLAWRDEQASDDIKEVGDVGILLRDLCIVDVDDHATALELEKRFPVLLHVPTEQTARGRHYWFSRPHEVADRVGFYDGASQVIKGVDFKSICKTGTSGFVLVAPSTNKMWLRAPWDAPCGGGAIPEIPLALLEAIARPTAGQINRSMAISAYVKRSPRLHITFCPSRSDCNDNNDQRDARYDTITIDDKKDMHTILMLPFFTNFLSMDEDDDDDGKHDDKILFVDSAIVTPESLLDVVSVAKHGSINWFTHKVVFKNMLRRLRNAWVAADYLGAPTRVMNALSWGKARIELDVAAIHLPWLRHLSAAAAASTNADADADDKSLLLPIDGRLSETLLYDPPQSLWRERGEPEELHECYDDDGEDKDLHHQMMVKEARDAWLFVPDITPGGNLHKGERLLVNDPVAAVEDGVFRICPGLKEAMMAHPGRIMVAGGAVLGAVVEPCPEGSDLDIFIMDPAIRPTKTTTTTTANGLKDGDDKGSEEGDEEEEEEGHCEVYWTDVACRAEAIADAIVQSIQTHNKTADSVLITRTQNTVMMIVHKNDKRIVIQIILMVYENPCQLLRSFDLFPSQIGMWYDDEEDATTNVKILRLCATRSWVEAVRAMAFPLVVSDCWGHTSIVRCLKYHHKGFEVAIPGTRRDCFKQDYMNLPTQPIVGRSSQEHRPHVDHSLAGLFKVEKCILVKRKRMMLQKLFDTRPAANTGDPELTKKINSLSARLNALAKHFFLLRMDDSHTNNKGGGDDSRASQTLLRKVLQSSHAQLQVISSGKSSSKSQSTYTDTQRITLDEIIPTACMLKSRTPRDDWYDDGMGNGFGLHHINSAMYYMRYIMERFTIYWFARAPSGSGGDQAAPPPNADRSVEPIFKWKLGPCDDLRLELPRTLTSRVVKVDDDDKSGQRGGGGGVVCAFRNSKGRHQFQPVGPQVAELYDVKAWAARLSPWAVCK